MRNSSVATVGLAVLCACAVWVSGCNCGSDGGGADGGPNDPLVEGGPDASVEVDAGAPDSGVDAGVDAGAVLVDGGTDAGVEPVDGGFDAGLPGLAFVEVTKGGLFEPGVVVVFHDALGAVKSTSTTDSSGLAWGTVVAGDQVTVVLGSPGEARLLTYVGVEPQDRLQVEAPLSPPTRDVSIPIATPPPGTNAVTVAAGNRECATRPTGASTIVRLTSDCRTGAGFSVLEAAFDSTRYSFSFKRGNALADAGTVEISGLSNWRLGTSHSLQVANVPTIPNATASFALGQVSDDEVFVLDWKSIALNGGAGIANFDFDADLAFGLVGMAQFRIVKPQGVAVSSFAQLIVGGATSQTIDLSDGLLPLLSSIEVGAVLPGRPTISWSTEAPVPAAKGGVVRLKWASAAEKENVWTFVVPPAMETVTAPALPTEFAGWSPGSIDFGDPAVAGATVALFELDAVLSYRGFRLRAGRGRLTRDPQRGTIWPWAGAMRTTSISR